MKNFLKGTNFKISLIAKIKGLAEESKRARQKILKSRTDKQVWSWSYNKYLLGLDTRHHLLAYAYLKGLPYHLLEKKCRKEHQPDPNAILQVITAHALKYWTGHELLTLNAIEKWLNGEEL